MYSGSDFYSCGRELLFVQTCFGWTVGGRVPTSSQPHSVASSRASTDVKEAPDVIFQIILEQQEIPAESCTISLEDQCVLDHSGHPCTIVYRTIPCPTSSAPNARVGRVPSNSSPQIFHQRKEPEVMREIGGISQSPPRVPSLEAC